MNRGDVTNRKITFKNFMALNDRTNSGCFLRSNLITPSDILIPVSSFNSYTPSTALSQNDPVAFTTTDDTVFFLGKADVGGNGVLSEISSAGTITEQVNSASIANVNCDGIVYYPEQDYISIIDSAGEYHTYDVAADTFNANVDSEPATGQNSLCYAKRYATVYWTADDAIHQDDNGTITNDVFTLIANSARNILVPYKDWVVNVQNQLDTDEVFAQFWDGDPANTIPDHSPTISSGKLLGAGVVNTKFLVAVWEPENTNGKYLSRIVVYQYLGGGEFGEISRLPLKDTSNVARDVSYSCDGKYLYISTESPAETGYEDYGVYKIDHNGNFSVHMASSNIENEVIGVVSASFWGGLVVLAYEDDSNVVRIAIQKAITDRANASGSINMLSADYVTQMLEDSFIGKKLVYFDIGVKTINAAKEVRVYYRTDEDDSWTQLQGDIDDNNYGATNAERLTFTGANTNNTMPFFREIQFRITSRSGAIITYAGYGFREQHDKPIIR